MLNKKKLANFEAPSPTLARYVPVTPTVCMKWVLGAGGEVGGCEFYGAKLGVVCFT